MHIYNIYLKYLIQLQLNALSAIVSKYQTEILIASLNKVLSK